jgi:hypothetical protein
LSINYNKILKKLKKEIQLQTKITTDIKINRHKIIHKNKVKKLKHISTVSNLLNIKENINNNSNAFLNNFNSLSTTNTNLYNKTISLASTITKSNSNTNTNTNSQKELNISHIKNNLIKNLYFDINIMNNEIKKDKVNNKYLKRTKSSKNNLYRNNIINTYNCKKEKNTYYPSYHKYKRSNSKFDLIFKMFKNLDEINGFENNEINVNNNYLNLNLKKNTLKKSYSKPILNHFNNYNLDNIDSINLLLNRFPNIEKHRKYNFNQELKHTMKDIKNETLKQSNKLVHTYSQKNLMTPYKIILKNKFSSNLGTNNEDIYKFNIVAHSKIMDIEDIQKKNIDRFFNTEKYENNKRSTSLENLKNIINHKSPRYISDYFYNKNIRRSGIKITKYKSLKLHEIYDSLNN